MMKNNSFKSFETVKPKISELGLGDLRETRNDSLGWIATSSYFNFGEPNIQNGMYNNIAFYIEGVFECKINEIKIVLNLNNFEKKYDGIEYFEVIVSSFFEALYLDYSDEIKSSILNFKFFEDEYITINNNEKSKIDTLKVIIH